MLHAGQPEYADSAVEVKDFGTVRAFFKSGCCEFKKKLSNSAVDLIKPVVRDSQFADGALDRQVGWASWRCCAFAVAPYNAIMQGATEDKIVTVLQQVL